MASHTHAETPYRSRFLRPLTFWHAIYAFLGCLLVSLIAFKVFQPLTVLPRIMLSPGFALTNQSGALVSNEMLRGNLTLFSFVDTGCEAACPQTAAQIAALRQTLSGRLPADTNLHFATIALNAGAPAAQLATYAQPYMAETGRIPWHFLRGNPTPIRYIVGGGFNLYYIQSESTSRVIYDPRFVLVDGAGIVRAYYDTAEPEIDIVLRDIELVMQEARNATGAGKAAYEAAHLFACYPR